MRDIRLILLFVMFCASAYSQSDSVLAKNANARLLKRMGKSALKQHDPVSAITFFEACIKKNNKDVEAKNYLGQAYLQVRDYERAQRQFLNVYQASKKKYPEALYYHAMMQKSNGLYDSAKINFAAFKKQYKGNNKVMKRQAGKEIAFCDSVSKIQSKRDKIVISRLDTMINKVNTEAAPLVMDENTLVYTSLRTEKREIINDEDTGKSIKRKLYLAKRKNGKWKFAGEYGIGLNDPEFNTGNACLSPDRKRMYFTRCKPNYNGEMICAIYVSEKVDDNWTEPVKLPKNINNPKYTSTMPTITTDPVKGSDVIYFVSNAKKGKGGLDIWYTVYNKKTKTYKDPKNAGSKINTSQNEMSPYFDNETQSLYFSSDGLGGLGGYDVYKATGDGKRWTTITNIGQPVNSGADEIYYTISPNRKEGFFVSNRKGGNALKNATCCDDIYSYINNQYVNVNLKGSVNDMLDPFSAIGGATVEIFLKDPKTNEKFLVKTVETDSKGNYTARLEPDQDYVIVVKKNDFLGSSAELTTKGVTGNLNFDKDLHLLKRPKDPIHIPNIQYEFDRSNIMESSKLSIDTTVLRLMQLNPELIIEIQSHTDSKGNDKYNLKLSQKRAESVVNYLVAKGISVKRLKAMGYGESKPVAPNENADGSDNPDGRAKNRRTDFKIIGVVDAEIINDGGVD